MLLDGQDITTSLNEQYPLPEAVSTGIWPSRNSGEWYDLLKCISDNQTLAQSFFNGGDNGVHMMEIINPEGSKFEVRLLLRMKYSARNR